MSGSDYLRHNNLRSCVWGYLFRRSLLGNLRFHEGITREDEEFTPQLMLRAEQLVDTDAVAYYYRKREGSVMEADDNRAKARRLDDLLTVLDTLTERLDRLPADDRAALQRRVDQLTMDYLINIITTRGVLATWSADSCDCADGGSIRFLRSTTPTSIASSPR